MNRNRSNKNLYRGQRCLRTDFSRLIRSLCHRPVTAEVQTFASFPLGSRAGLYLMVTDCQIVTVDLLLGDCLLINELCCLTLEALIVPYHCPMDL